MATEKILNTRVQLKYDTWENWSNVASTGIKGNLVLKKGEVGICEIPASTNAGQSTSEPVVLFKVGDGVKAFKNLSWVSGKAADVYAWAKKSKPDWEDFPALPITVVDNGSGKFVTDITYQDNKITITRADAVNSLDVNNTEGNPVTLAVDKSTGAVKVGATHATALNSTFTGGAKAGSVNTAGDNLTIKVPKIEVNTYGHVTSATDVDYSITIPNAVTPNDGTLTLKTGNGLSGNQKTFSANDAGDVTFEVSHGAKPTTGNAHTTTAGTGRTYVTKVDVDSYGHIAKVYTASETVTNTAHTHGVGAGLTQDANGGVDGKVTTSLNLKFELDSNEKMQLKDATSGTVVAQFDASDFIKDGFLTNVEFDEAKNNLVFTWNIVEEGQSTEKVLTVSLADLVDVYTSNNPAAGTAGAVDVTISGYKVSAALQANAVTSAYIKDGAVTEAKIGAGAVTEAKIGTDAVTTAKIKNENVTYGKLSADVQASLDLADSAVQPSALNGYKTKRTSALADQKLTGAYVFSGVAQDVNGDITCSTRQLSYSDIGAQKAGSYEAAGTAQSLVNGLDSEVAATAESNNQVSVLTKVTQTNGKLASKSEVKLAAIAKTGSVADLIQPNDIVLVFDCGDASNVSLN